MLETTRQALELGVIGFLDAPPGLHLTLDMNSIVTGENFKGIKMIPQGLHLLTWASNEHSPRTGKFLIITKHDPDSASHDPMYKNSQFVFRWEPQEETFHQCDLRADDIASNFIRAARALYLDKELGAFPTRLHQRWLALSSSISPVSLRRFIPRASYIYADTDASFETKMAMALKKHTTGAQEPSEDRTLSSDSNVTSDSAVHSKLHYSFISGVSPGSTPQSRTQFAMDTSPALLHLLLDRQRNIVHDPHTLGPDGTIASVQRCGEQLNVFRVHQSNMSDAYEDILCEYQVSFLLFLLCQSYASFEQWKHFTDIFLRIDSLLIGTSLFLSNATSKELSDFHSFLLSAYSILFSHLMEIPADMFSEADPMDFPTASSDGASPANEETSCDPVNMKNSNPEDIPGKAKEHTSKSTSNFLFRSLGALFRTLREVLREGTRSIVSTETVSDHLVLHVHPKSVFLNPPFVHILKRVLGLCLEKFLWIPKVDIFEGIHGFENGTEQTHLESIQRFLDARFVESDHGACDQCADDIITPRMVSEMANTLDETTTNQTFANSGTVVETQPVADFILERRTESTVQSEQQREFRSMEELLASLRLDAGDDDLPTIVYDESV